MLSLFSQLRQLRQHFQRFGLRGVTIHAVTIRDKRTVGEQIKSGFRLVGWVLLTLAFISLILGSINLLTGKGDHVRPLFRVLGACGLVAASSVMFVTIRHWVKWFFGFLAYSALKVAIAFLLGFTPSMPSIVRPRLVFLELLVLLMVAVVLCLRYLTHAPRKIEAAGLVVLVITISFSMVYDSNLPIICGIALLGVTQLVHSGTRSRLTHALVERRPR